jgi:alkaline phosphatase
MKTQAIFLPTKFCTARKRMNPGGTQLKSRKDNNATIRRSKMKKGLSITLMLLFFVGISSAGAGERFHGSSHLHHAGKHRAIARFGIITDIHHTNKADTTSRRYSAALAKTGFFVDAMNREKVDFIIELGDFVDTLAENKDPVQNLDEIESVFTSFKGPQFHVLGNHEFDNVRREDLLPRLNNTGIEQGVTYYSFDRNGIHCIVLDADYTVAEPHRPFDLQDAGNTFWNWKDAWIPQEELDWLEDDLAHSNLPTAVFCHQLFHRDNTEDHTIKNADTVRGILEADGQVLAVFSGHDHRGEIAFRNGIHYLVLEGNVGMSLDWSEVSPTGGLDPIKDCPFSMVEIKEMKRPDTFSGLKTYEVILKGNAQQYTFKDQIQIVEGL